MKKSVAVLSMLAVAALGSGGVNAADPKPKDLQRVVDAAHARYKGLQEGKNADYIPILTKTPSELFGVVIATRDGKIYTPATWTTSSPSSRCPSPSRPRSS